MIEKRKSGYVSECRGDFVAKENKSLWIRWEEVLLQSRESEMITYQYLRGSGSSKED